MSRIGVNLSIDQDKLDELPVFTRAQKEPMQT